jgi:PIN domain nuclease of toxin-antitoxin system
MKYLLDTHVVLWYVAGTERLPRPVVELIDEDPTACAVSIASLWAISIKQGLGKLKLHLSMEEFLARGVQGNSFQTVAITIPHVVRVARLPHHHRDPFDRMLVAQAMEESLDVVSADPALDAYGVRSVW